jgi:hypothetical protein
MKTFIWVLVAIVFLGVAVFVLQNVFTVSEIPAPAQQITILTPNGGEKFMAGDAMTVEWRTTMPSKLYELSLVFDNPAGVGGYTFNKLELANEVTEGKVNLILPNTTIPGDTYKLQILDLSRPVGDQYPIDVSDTHFSISTTTPYTIDLKDPKGGETWKVGSVQTIQWQTSPNVATSTTISFSLVSESNFTTLLGEFNNDGDEKVIVPELKAGKYKAELKTVNGQYFITDYAETEITIVE